MAQPVTQPRSILLLHGVGSSATTFWRATEDLGDLGWQVTALDLPGHGRRALGPALPQRVADLAADVAEQAGGATYDVVLGHSLGALVALALAAARPDVARLVVLEDPPALGGSFTAPEIADDLVAEVERVYADPGAAGAAMATANPRWAAEDVVHVLENRRLLDTRVLAVLRGEPWDLPALVRACPVPVALIAAAGPDTMLGEPGRTAVLAELPADRIVLVPGGHGVHRDRPALWLQALLRLSEDALRAPA